MDYVYDLVCVFEDFVYYFFFVFWCWLIFGVGVRVYDVVYVEIEVIKFFVVWIFLSCIDGNCCVIVYFDRLIFDYW